MPKNDTHVGRFSRFEEENFRKNLEFADRIREIADEESTTPGQRAPARLL